jgi:hypothetical protein
MLSKAGIAIFVFGNKIDTSGKVVSADGMLEEFQIAYRRGLFLVPVGATGYTAEVLYKKISDDFYTYFPKVGGIKVAWAALNKKGTPDQIVERILKFLSFATSTLQSGRKTNPD